jgi:hypothetical protein
VFKGLISIRPAFVCVLLSALIARVSTSSAAATEAETEPLRIELAAASSCPAEPDLLERVRRHTPLVRQARPGEIARTLQVTVTHRPTGGFVADLRLVEGTEALERHVPGATCEEVLAAVALITALTIDPLASTTPGLAAPPPVPSDAAPPLDARPPVRPPPAFDAGTAPGSQPPVEPVRVRTRMGVSLEAFGLGELVPAAALWIEGGLTRRLAPSVRLRLARTRSFTVEPEMRPAFFQLTTGAVEGCVVVLGASDELRPRASSLQLRPCLHFAAGILDGASSAFGAVQETKRAWVAFGGVLQGRWLVLGPLALEAAAGLTVPFVRDDFFFLPQIDVYRAPPVAFVGSVGVGTTFR